LGVLDGQFESVKSLTVAGLPNFFRVMRIVE
jgi:hypothetical protein